MKSESKESRRKLERIVKSDRKTLLVAFDHAIASGPTSGSENVAWVLDEITKGRADGVLVNPGVARRFFDPLRRGGVGIIVSIPLDPLFIKLASDLGADAVKTTFFGDVFNRSIITRHEEVAAACVEYSIPYLTEIVPAETKAGQTKVLNDPWLVSVAARKAAEIGADIVKTSFTGEHESFKKVVDSTFIPVVILGGEKLSDNKSVLDLAQNAIVAGASGVAFGRNIWKNEHPREIVAALRSLIHSSVK